MRFKALKSDWVYSYTKNQFERSRSEINGQKSNV